MSMTLRERAYLIGKAFKGTFDLPADSVGLQLLKGIYPSSGGEPPARTTQQHLNGYNTMPWLRTCASKVAYATATVDWKLYVRQSAQKKPIRDFKAQRLQGAHRRSYLKSLYDTSELKEIEQHPLLDFLNEGNTCFKGFTCRKLMQISLDLVGESFAIKERNALGAPVRSWPIPAHWVVDTPTPSHRFYRVSFRGFQGDIPDTEVLYLRDPNPVHPYGRGTGIAQALADELETDEYACHDDQTECLTRRGWVRGLDLQPSDELATWNEAAQCLEYQRATELHRYPYSGMLHHWTGRSIDALVTPNHRLWLRSKIYSRPANPEPIWHFEESQQAMQKPGRVFAWRDAGNYEGAETVVHIPGVERITKRKPGSRGGGRPPRFGINDPLTFKARDFARFLGYYISEGDVSRAALGIAQRVGNYDEDIRQSLRIFPQAWLSEKIRDCPKYQTRHINFQVLHLGLAEWIRAHVGVGSYQKRLPACVFEWQRDAQEELLIGLVNGDGNWTESHHGKAAQYQTMSRGLADDVQRLCVQLGYSSTIGRGIGVEAAGYRVNMRCHTHLRFLGGSDHDNWMQEVPYEGEVWCATVQNDTLITRRNGRVLVSGNSKHLKAFFYNRARPDFIIYPKNDGLASTVNKSEVMRLEKDWTDKNQGFWKAFRPYFMTREVGIHEFEQNFQHLQLIELLKHERDTIIQVFGFPPELFGILESSNRATIEGAEVLFARWCVEPRLEFQRSELQSNLVPDYDERLILDYESPVQDDKEFQLKAMTAMPTSVRVNEWRHLQELDPIDGPEGDMFVKPGTVSVIDKLEVTPPPVSLDGSTGMQNGSTGQQSRFPIAASLRTLPDVDIQKLYEIAERLED